MDHVGVLKTLGATPKQIWVGFLNILLFVGLISVLLGLFFGVSLHILIVELLASLIPVELPAPGPRPLVLGAITGLICALSFAMPAFVHLRNISPMRVLRRDLDISPASRLLSYGAAILGSLTLLVWYTESLFLTFWSLLGIVSVLVFFGLVAVVLLRGTGIAGMQAKSGWRLALAGLQRRKNENIAQMLIFGLAIMLLLVLVLIRTSLIEEWEAQVPKDAPNHFLMNINASEVESIGQLIRTRASKANEIYPMIRGRVNQVNEVEAKEWQKNLERPYEGVRISSERNLTWLENLPENNEIVAGEWWGPQTTEPLVSLEEEYANDLGLGLGDRILFDIGGKLVETQVASIRRLEWESMSPNFFIIFSPASLSDFSATYMTSFFLEKEDKRFLNDILSQHPTTTVIEIDALIEQVQKIVGQVTQAVELVMFLVLFSGCLVLLASIQASRDTRIAELALVRALGGTKKLIGGSLFVEFLLLGTMAGVVAVVGAEMTVALLQAQIFDLSFNLHPWLWLLGPVAGGLIITLVGYFGSRGLLDAPPMNVLRGA
jgi:putative ABC transport system permease protein